MTATLEATHSRTLIEPLDKLFHVLFTKSMYAELEILSTRLKLSKAAIIRTAIEKYIHDLQERTLAPWTDLSYQAI